MEDVILYYWILLLLGSVLIRTYLNYRKASKNVEILLSTWARPLSLLDMVLFIVLVYIISDTSKNIMDKENYFAVIYCLWIIVSVICNAKLVISEKGIYFLSQFASWDRIEEITLESQSFVSIQRKSFLCRNLKIRNFYYDDNFLSFIEKKCPEKISRRV